MIRSNNLRGEGFSGYSFPLHKVDAIEKKHLLGRVCAAVAAKQGNPERVRLRYPTSNPVQHQRQMQHPHFSVGDESDRVDDASNQEE
ncbi:hypothetical protein NDI49_30995 [Trichocoleus sp. ST-U3]